MHQKSWIYFLLALSLAGCKNVKDFSGFTPKEESVKTEYSYQVIKDPTGSAPTEYVERFEVRAGDCVGWDCTADRERYELGSQFDNFKGSEYWYGWSIFIPEDFPTLWPTRVYLGQFHPKDFIEPAFMFLHSNSGLDLARIEFGRTYDHLAYPSELLGKWTRFEVRAKWHKTDGFVETYVNGELKSRYEGRTLNPATTQFKYGIYRVGTNEFKERFGAEQLPTQIVYYSNVKRGATRQSLLPE